MRRWALLCIPIALAFFAVTWAPSVSADRYYSLEPPAYYASGYRTSYVDNAKILDRQFASMAPTSLYGSYLLTRDFTAPVPEGYVGYTVYWPGSNATISAVYATACIAYNPDEGANRTFWMAYSVGISNVTFTAKAYSGTYTAEGYAGEYWQFAYMWNITDYETWTWDMVTSDTFWLKLYSNNYGDSTAYLYIDYLGLFVNYTQPGSAPPSEDWYTAPPSNYTFTPGIWYTPAGGLYVGILGTFGFLGLVATPVVGVWFARHSSESRITIGVKVLAMMGFCGGLFLWAVAGS